MLSCSIENWVPSFSNFENLRLKLHFFVNSPSLALDFKILNELWSLIKSFSFCALHCNVAHKKVAGLQKPLKNISYHLFQKFDCCRINKNFPKNKNSYLIYKHIFANKSCIDYSTKTVAFFLHKKFVFK